MIALHHIVEALPHYERQVRNGRSDRKLLDIVIAALGPLGKDAVSFAVPKGAMTKEHFEFGYALLDKNLIKLPFPHVLFQIPEFTVSFLCTHDDENGLVFIEFKRLPNFTEPVPISIGNKAPDGKLYVGTFLIGELGDRLVSLFEFSKEQPTAGDRLHKRVSHNLGWIVCCCSLLMSKNIYVEIEAAPEKLNKKRALRGKPPIGETRYIKIRTDERLVARGHRGGSHASPVMHWRRGHIRRLQNGKFVPVAPTIVNASDEHKPLAKEYIIS